MQNAIAIKNAGIHPVYGKIIKDKIYQVSDDFDFDKSELFRKQSKTTKKEVK